METLAIILAGGKGSRLDLLSERRSKPAMPFAGKFRIIDFTLSNCSNSGIFDVAILTQYLPLSLNEHIGSGKPWDLDRRDSAVTLLQPHAQWYGGTADAVLKNVNFIKRRNPKYVLILSGDHIYKMNYNLMVQEHIKNDAELTIATTTVPLEEASRFGILSADKNNRIVDFEEKPAKPKSDQASMGIYVFNTDALIDALENLGPDENDFGKHIIPKFIFKEKRRVFSYPFEGYWMDVGTIDSYLETSLDLLNPDSSLDLYDETWKVHTRSEELPPVKIGFNAKISNSLISNGSVIEGTVINSILSPGVYVGKNSVVKDSVLFNFTHVGENVHIERAIIDKKVKIGDNVKIGFGDDYTPNLERPDLLSNGVNILAKHSRVPKDTIITRNVRVFDTGIFTTKNVKSGETIK